MKRKLFGLIFAAAVATPLVTLTSCSDDDKSEVVFTPFIKVYNTQLTFNETMTQALIQGIVSNVEIEVVSFPSWIESVTLSSENAGEFYTAIVTLKSNDYDDAKREGVITFKDKASDYVADYTILCDPNSFNLKLEWASEFDEIFDSSSDIEGGITKAIVTVTSRPGKDVEIRAYEKMGFRYGSEPSENVTITEVPVTTRAAYNVKSYEISFANYPFSSDWGSNQVREFRIFPVPVEQLDIFNPNQNSVEDFKDAIQYRNDIIRIDEGQYISFPNEGGAIDIAFQASEECNILLGELNFEDWSVTPPNFSDYTIIKKSESAIERGMKTYVYTITMGACPEDLEWGRNTSIILLPSDNNQIKQLNMSQDGWY
ncbi:MAG: hypothetical protein ACRCZM_06745 [Bacteroidales bacterium]